MALWILSFCIMAIEAWGSIYFFDTFMERKRTGWLGKCRYVSLYLATMAVAFLSGHFFSMGIKVLAAVLLFMTERPLSPQQSWGEQSEQ